MISLYKLQLLSMLGAASALTLKTDRNIAPSRLHKYYKNMPKMPQNSVLRHNSKLGCTYSTPSH